MLEGFIQILIRKKEVLKEGEKGWKNKKYFQREVNGVGGHFIWKRMVILKIHTHKIL